MKNMKLHCIRNYLSMAATAALLPLGISTSHASPAPTPLDANSAVLQQAQLQRVDWEEAKKHKLRRAYWLLSEADRDYKGHRAKAIEEVKKAGDIIGMDLHGEGWGGEHQVWSDERLREARQLLIDVAEKSGGAREHEHLRIAIHELDRALEVR
jgi:hypothetical protein